MWRWLYTITLIIHQANSATGEQPKIVIVGAGAAGVAAASKLYDNGFQNVIILETEDRIGGRIHTTRFDGRWVDYGAQWVHGQTNNIVFELASPLGLLVVPPGDTDILTAFYDSQGSRIPTSIASALLRVFRKVDEKSHRDLKGSNKSIGDYFTQMVPIEALKYPKTDETLLRQFMKVFEGFHNTYHGSDSWYNVSAKGASEFATCPGSELVTWKDMGYATVLDILMKKYPNPEDELPVRTNTQLNSTVVKIDYNSTESKVLVELSNGKKYVADHVIVTPSLGVLKEQYETLFSPELPEFKVKSIEGLSMGVADKLFLSFEAPWWDAGFPEFALLWTESDEREYKNDAHKKWMLDLVAFFPVGFGQPILCGWLNGQGARNMEALPEDQVLDQITVLLHKFLGMSYNITRPIRFSRSSWYTNKHFRGGYSYRCLECDAANIRADLAAPLLVDDKPVVMFAGEATHLRHFSTVHGAIESGFREANRLVSFYNTTMEFNDE